MDHQIEVGGRIIPLRLRRSALARRVSLRLTPGEEIAVLVLPLGTREDHALRFARSRADWLAEKLAQRPPRIPFAEGQVIPFLGQHHRLIAAAGNQRGIVLQAGEIHVPGQSEHFARRTRDWLMKQSRREIEQLCLPMSQTVGRKISRIRLSDPKSRWGSANSKAVLCFSWRLILAPAEVLHYVVAHEVAHLVEMNHSPSFWRIVEELAPGANQPRQWLKQNGAGLHLFG